VERARIVGLHAIDWPTRSESEGETEMVIVRLHLAAGAAALLAALTVPAGLCAQDLTDPEVAHVAVTANAIDVDLAKLALERGRSDEVKAFARTMVEDHTGVNEQAAALAKRLGVTPAQNEVSASLQKGADEARANLSGLTGAAFDRAYMAREVEYHQAVLDALDGLLLPTTENAELKSLLSTARGAIAAHLERARAIQSSIER
jgi:putative membrane protein